MVHQDYVTYIEKINKWTLSLRIKVGLIFNNKLTQI